MELGFDFKKNFFDRESVTSKVDKASRKVLSGLGALVRTIAKNSIKMAKGKSAGKASSPGQPPMGHISSGFTRLKKKKGQKEATPQPASPLKELIYFAYDPEKRSVVAGPQVFRNAKSKGTPRRLEKGGQTTISDGGKTKTITIRKRPFMGPALNKATPKFADQLRNMLSKG